MERLELMELEMIMMTTTLLEMIGLMERSERVRRGWGFSWSR